MSETVLEALSGALDKAAVWNRSASQAPVAVLWTDEGRQWEAIVPLLRARHPRIVTLGEYAPEALTGPAIWIRCLLARQLEGAAWPPDAIPVIYLPGVSRTRFRAIETCDPAFAAIAEVQYRGVFFTHPNGRDWTVHGFLKSAEGLGLDVADDKATGEAMLRALPALADTPVDQLRKGRLEAADFNLLLRPEPERDLLRWMNDPKAVRARWTDPEWKAFCDLCKAGYGFDPQRDGELVAAERLGKHSGAWAAVWKRFAEAPRNYPGVVGLLERAHPQQLALDSDRSVWPRYNAEDESRLRVALAGLGSLTPYEGRMRVLALESEHGQRRSWPWAELGQAPLAKALESLTLLATLGAEGFAAADAEAMATQYTSGAHLVDDAAMCALAAVSRSEDVAAVQAALKGIYVPWLQDSAERLQTLVRRDGYPKVGSSGEAAPECGVLFFADGLRFDVGRRLARVLASMGYDVAVRHRWSAVPSVTATCKPTVSPIAASLVGTESGEDFSPSVSSGSGGPKVLSVDRFRGLVRDAGYQVLAANEVGMAAGRAWVEYGDLDHMGHQEGWKLAWRIEEQVLAMAERVAGLLSAGWQAVRVVTDHGWLLVPGGMPKVELGGVLAETRWGRCAVLKSSASGGDRLLLDWHWSTSVRIAVPPGISAYKAGIEYSHGGVSVQECVTPVLIVKTKTTGGSVRIDELSWTQMRCRFTVSGLEAGFAVDVRKRPADAQSSVLGSMKVLTPSDGVCKGSVVVGDDEVLGEAVSVVVVDPSGVVVAKRATTVGGD